MNKSFVYDRVIHFQDTDAAGVVYFANGLSLCHEAYEASLAASGINLKSFFRGEAIAVPITHASIDFFKPMFCGDRITISLVPTLLNSAEFQVEYKLYFEMCFQEENADKRRSPKQSQNILVLTQTPESGAIFLKNYKNGWNLPNDYDFT